ncbi:DUF1059 domain-containing protein [Oceanospirillum sanctuarii]|uniref:DUF1059 domain-containing protein n=1 Tax=Oceanospirillum sanctuarii TaxID=1434821 RepID=UPI000A36C1B9|nr:DUF1059 domain-containing protein [Oceanospirillum sanctuarii]
MKTMSCKELGGACDQLFHAETFEQIAEMSKQHGIEMYQQQDSAHLEAMQKMQQLMSDPAAMQVWFESKREAFNQLPED